MNLKTIVRPLVAALIVGGFAMNASANVANGTFTVSLTVTKTCAVTTTAASNIILGSTIAGGTSTSSNGTFTVNCSKTTPFFIGLAPSNASTAGTGVLKGTGANGDTVTYGLFSNTGATTPWGNTATTTTQGNGVGGIGAGMAAGNAITETVYAKATGSTDVTPDTYTDTVTINVNF